MLKRNLQEERLSFTINLPEAVKVSEIIFIAVGTPLGQDGSADMSHVLSVAESNGREMNGYKVETPLPASHQNASE